MLLTAKSSLRKALTTLSPTQTPSPCLTSVPSTLAGPPRSLKAAKASIVSPVPLEPACSELPELLLQGKYYQSFSVALAALEKSQHQMSQILNKGGPARLERVTSVLSQAPPSPDTHSFFSGLGIPLPLPPLLCPVSLINSPVFRHCPHRILLALRSS